MLASHERGPIIDLRETEAVRLRHVRGVEEVGERERLTGSQFACRILPVDVDDRLRVLVLTAPTAAEVLAKMAELEGDK